MKTLISSSPDVARLKELLNIQQNYARELRRHLFDNEKQNGLWNAYCNDHPVDLDVAGTPHEKSYWISLTDQQNGRWWRYYVPRQFSTRKTCRVWHGLISKLPGELPVSELSKSRPFLSCMRCDWFCVECKHAYIYRDPYSVLDSTTLKRNHNQLNVLKKAIHLHTPLLQIINSQLQDHSNRTVACRGFFEPTFSVDEVWNPIRKNVWI